ncbi:MAG: hypothetical protein ACREIV_02710 [Planctomycetaceae bacterium]
MRHARLRSFAIALMLLCPCAAAAQEGLVELLAPSNSALPPAEAPNDAGIGYWVVSSRRCRQLSNEPAADCRLDFFFAPPHCPPQRCDEQAFLRSLDPSVPVCFIVHGSNFTLGDVSAVARPLAGWLRPAIAQPMQFVFFAWPSDVPLFSVNASGHRASYNAVFLAQLVARLPAGQPVCFHGHSHGARLCCAALHLLAGGEVMGYRFHPAPPTRRRYRAVLVAAAVDHHWLNPGERFGRAVPICEYLVNVRNREDFALRLYPFRRPCSGQALGRVGLTPHDRARLGLHGGRVGELDVTAVIGDSHGWGDYVRHPGIAQAIGPALAFPPIMSH